MAGKVYRRILVKLSGETLSGESGFGFDENSLEFLAEEIVEARKVVREIGVVLGGGNIFRGINSPKLNIDKRSGDYIGMLATVINGILLKEILTNKGLKVRLFNSFDFSPFVEGYSQVKALESLEEGFIVIFSGGTGHPFFTTDTTAVLRALEIKADILLKATKVDGIYSKDPKKDKNAKKFTTLTYDEAIANKLNILDQSAFALARDNNLSIYVFDFFKKGNLKRVLNDEKIGTSVKGG